MYRWQRLLLLLFLTFYFTWYGTAVMDPDFGWHLAAGQMFLRSGIPATDPFSYTMPSFPWIDHELGTNIVFALLYPLIGLVGLAAIYAIIAVTALVLTIPRRLQKWSLIWLLLTTAVFLPRIGVRPQIVDWLFLAFLLRIFENIKFWNRWKFLIPVIFTIWANLHGGFPMGLAVLGVAIIARSLEIRKLEKKDLLVLFMSLLATGVNPYGFRLWNEIILQMTDTHLRGAIGEWLPFWYQPELSFWMITVFVAVLVKRYFRELAKWRIAVAILAFILSLFSLRFAPLFVITAGVLIAEGLSRFYEEIRLYPIMASRGLKFYKLLILISVVVLVLETGLYLRRLKGVEIMYYPAKAVEFLQNQNNDGNLFSTYGWGGYLIWKLPEKKVFVDGRMPSWRWPYFSLASFAWSGAIPKGESDWAFKEYEKVVNNGDYEEVFRKYDVKIVLWPKPVKENREFIRWLNKGLSFGRSANKIMWWERLKEEGWVQIYSDESAMVWKRDA